MDDAELKELLARATDDPPATLGPRVRAAMLDELATAAGVEASDVTAHRGRAVRWSVIGLAAAVLAVLGVGLVWRAAVGSDDRATVATDPGAPFLLPTQWPEDMADRPTSTGTMDTLPRVWDRPSLLLARDGEPEAMAMFLRASLPEAGDVPGATEVLLADGRRAARGASGSGLTVALSPELMMSLTSDAEAPALEALAMSFDAEGRMGELPAGWRVVPDPTGLLALSFGGLPPALEMYLAARDSGPKSAPFRTATLVTAVVDDAEAELDRVAAEGASRVDVVDLGPQGRAMLITPLDESVRTLVWARSEHHFAMVGGTGLHESDLIALARSVEAVSELEWRALMPPDLSDDTTVDTDGPGSTTTVLGDTGPAGTVVGG